jgi:uncharacterized ferredoxin-like protein
MIWIIIIVIAATIYLLIHTKDAKGCDFDCEHCPFPECSEEDKKWLFEHSD